MPTSEQSTQARGRMTLEAIRLGVVPAADVGAYTVGRETELATVDADLSDADGKGGAVRAFMGDYGLGKTHLLELIQHRALSQGFLVARAMLDGHETSPSHPGRVYRALIRGLRDPERPYEEGTALERLLARASAEPKALERFAVDAQAKTPEAGLAAGAHLYISPALRYARHLYHPNASPGAVADRELLLSWLGGQASMAGQGLEQRLSSHCGSNQGRLYSLQDYRPWARIYAYLVSGLGTLARAVGYKGLVVVLDEAEFYAVLSGENRAHARRLFKALALASVGQEEGTLPFDAAELDPGGAGIQRTLPARYGDHPGLYTVLAMTPQKAGMDALRAAVPWRRISDLKGLEREHYVELARQVLVLYKRSHPGINLPDAIIGPLAQVMTGLIGTGYIANPRQGVKFIVEFLDVVRFAPQDVAEMVRNLQRLLVF